MKKYLFSATLLLFSLLPCTDINAGKPQKAKVESTENSKDHSLPVTEILFHFWNSSSKRVLVAAHRADWHAAPENSLPAIQSCIDNGVDIVEVDNKLTKDGYLVIMHDKTVDRTTNGKGNVSDYTLAEIKKLYLKDKDGNLTKERIPTFEEVMNLCRGKTMVNIDQSYDYWDKVMEVLQKTNTTAQGMMKSGHPYQKVVADHGNIFGKIAYIPVISLDQEGAEEMVDGFLGKCPAVECCFKNATPKALQLMQKIADHGSRVWVNTLWASLNGGHDDITAFKTNNFKDTWEWLIKAGANVLQTDHSAYMVKYLTEHGMR